MLCGLPEKLVVTVTVSLRVPTTGGVKVTETVQLSNELSVAGQSWVVV